METCGRRRAERLTWQIDGTEPADPRIAGDSRRRLVVVSNRVATIDEGKPDSGGLAVAIRAALQENGGIWFGWSGGVEEQPGDEPQIATRGPLTHATLDLSPRDYDEYYIGFANRVLWPLFHFRGSLVEFSRRDYAGYLRVNRLFARRLAPMLDADDLVWVHDYHLIPLGGELRRLGCRQPIGFFLHTPFPPPELLRVLPEHQNLVKAMCAYDLVGFQTACDLRGFCDYLLRYAGAEDLGRGAYQVFGRVVRAQVFPIGIDTATVAAPGQGGRPEPAHAPLAAKPGGPGADDRGRPARLFEGPPRRGSRRFPTCSKPAPRRAAGSSSCRSRRHRARRCRNTRKSAAASPPRPAISTAATANSTARRYATSTRVSPIRS